MKEFPDLLKAFPNRLPDTEILEDGTKVVSIRVRRPKIDSVDMVGKENIKERVGQFDEWKQSDEGKKFADYPSTAAVFGSAIDYKKMMGDLGTKETVEMQPNPPLEMVFVRHLKHTDNLVSQEAKDEFRPRAEKIIDDLGISSEDEVYIVSSSSGQYLDTPEGIMKISRTQSTADVFASILKERGISYQTKIDTTDEQIGSVDSVLGKSLSEFQVADDALYDEATLKAKANSVAKKTDQSLPYPDHPSQVPTVYASHTEDIRELLGKTGMIEVSSATVARSLKGVDKVEDFFLKGDGKSDKRKVVIMAGHGQFITDITEALLVATDLKFPIVVANNGDYFTIGAGTDSQGEIIEEYEFKIPPKIEKK